MARSKVGDMSNLTRAFETEDPIPDQDQKRAALGYVHEAWAEARLDGIEDDCMAQACLFAALIEFVSTYGEDAAAKFAEGLPARIRNGEFSTDLSRQ
jgi:hypothetical protein